MLMVKRRKATDENEVEEVKWQDMKNDMLCKIFSSFTLLEVALSISSVCKSWRSACRDANSWDTLDLTKLNEHFEVPAHPSVPDTWSEPPLSRRFWDILSATTYHGNQKLTKIIFNLHICITDKHLVYVAERCPNVKLLVLPALSNITPEGYQLAFGMWKGLEAVVIPGCTFSPCIIQLLGKNCKKLRSLKMTGFVTRKFVISLSLHLPWLKALSIKSSMIKRETIVWTLEWLKELEEFNICHSCLVDMPLTRNENFGVDESILEKSTHLRMLHYCKDKDCMACVAVKGDPLGVASVKWRNLVVRLDEIGELSF